jgi:hypothetical protein
VAVGVFCFHRTFFDAQPAHPAELAVVQQATVGGSAASGRERGLAEYTTELLDVLHVLGRLVELEDAQREMLEKICSGPTISSAELKESEALAVPEAWRKKLTADSNATRNLLPADDAEYD